MKTTFEKVDPKQSFPKLEEAIMKKWEKENSFEKSINIRSNSEEFVFYDGPPFATGLPHYGHILAWTIKDVIPRYKTMRGYKVERKFWWDCHGLPVENLIEAELTLDDKKALQKFWIWNFNEACRSSVLRYVEEWEKIVNRMWRWVDFKNSYKTMDLEFMESTWWVFKQLWDKDMVYQWHKPMHICPRCATPLSNFEVNLWYKDLTDLSVTAKFRINSNECRHKIDFLAWTTTPWTLIWNCALAVWENIEYSIMTKWEHAAVLATDCLKNYEKELEWYELHATKLWKEFVEKSFRYDPLFHFFKNEAENWWFKIVIWDFVTTDSWTWIVHIAPAFWEDDMLLWKKENLPFIQHVKMDGHFTDEVKWFPNIPVKERSDNMKMDRNIVDLLQDEWKMFQKKPLRHSYPTCWRCETPLLNYATKSWFIKVENSKDKLIKNNEQITWVPEHIKSWRFWKWLEWAIDWAVSRNRYWGTPLPIWQNEITWNFICIWSVKELEDLTWEKVTDLHKHFVDKFDFEIKWEKWKYKRVEEVFDCWFESWAMPYASRHYPFDEKIILNNLFYAVRHWESQHNVDKLINCSLDWKISNLTKNWKQIASNQAEKLSKEVKFDYIFCSPFERTKQTAEIFKKYCWWEIIIDERLHESKLWEFDTISEDLWHNWKTDNDWWNKWPKNWESLKEMEDRVVWFFIDINNKYKWKNILIVSHARPAQLIWRWTKWQDNQELKMKWSSLIEKWVPFKIETSFKFPADFIAEWIDQTRGWFYTLHVLWEWLFQSRAFDNVIVNWIILAEDGQKMSKSKKNYPDPNLIMDKYWADAMRFYLMSSPVVEWEHFKFSEKGVEEVVKNILLPLWNSYSFFVMYANIDEIEILEINEKNLTELDKWILWELENLTKLVSENLDSYKLNHATRHFTRFIDNITNWYIRRSRKRFWSKTGWKNQEDKDIAYAVLHHALIQTSKLLAPFCPFITESIYWNLSSNWTQNSKLETWNPSSIHHESWPENSNKYFNNKLSKKIEITQNIISLWLSLRKKLIIKVRQPLKSIDIVLPIWIDINDQFETIKEELNIKEINILKDAYIIAENTVNPNAKLLWPKYWWKVQEIIREAKSGNYELLSNWNYLVAWEELTTEEIEIWFTWKDWRHVNSENWIVISLDTEITENLRLEWLARDIIRQIAEMRKDAWYEVTDRININISNKQLEKKFGQFINEETLSSFWTLENADKICDLKWIIIKIKK